MKRIVLIGSTSLLLAGCIPVIPLPISIVTSGLSGLSFLATGKSTTDHVISAAAEQDCALHRMAFGEEMCRTYAAHSYRPRTEYSSRFPGDHDGGFQIADTPAEAGTDSPDATTTAELPPKPEKKQKIDPLLIFSLAPPTFAVPTVSMDLSGVRPGVDAPAVTRTWDRPGSVDTVERAALPPLPIDRPSSTSLVRLPVDHSFLSLGSFRSNDRAHDLLSRFAYLEPNIMKVEVNGRTWRRVAVGPLSKAEAARLRREHSRVDGRDTWTFVK